MWNWYAYLMYHWFIRVLTELELKANCTRRSESSTGSIQALCSVCTYVNGGQSWELWWTHLRETVYWQSMGNFSRKLLNKFWKEMPYVLNTDSRIICKLIDFFEVWIVLRFDNYLLLSIDKYAEGKISRQMEVLMGCQQPSLENWESLR